MLKTSPVIPASPSTSPASFRHATATSRSHAHSLAHSSSISAAAGGAGPGTGSGSGPGAPPITRRSSSQSRSAAASKSAGLSNSASASMKSPKVSRSLARNASQDEAAVAGEKGSAVPAVNEQQNPQPNTLEPPLSPRPQPKTKPPGATLSTASSQATLAIPDAQASATLSPNKRRGSPSQLTEQAATTTIADSADKTSPKTAKRAKSDAPPKILPTKYEFCAVEDIVELVACMLAELITTNDAIRLSSAVLTRFHSRTPPGISVRDYLHRLARHATLTPPLLLAMVYYIDRLCAMYQEFTINTLTVHRFLITAATVASKGLSDSFWNNATYARVGGVRIQELKLLELEFLHRVDWKIVPNPEVLVAYYNGLVERTPGYTLELGGSSDDELIDDDSDELSVSPKE